MQPAAALEQYQQSNPYGSAVTLDEVVENMGFLDDWEARYGYIIDLGRDVPEMDDALKSDEAIVHGCQSQVWVHLTPRDAGILEIAADSDALIVRGLIAVVMAAMNRQPASQIVARDMEAVFAELDLLGHLSPMRGNGLRALVTRVQQEAARLQ